MPSNDTTLPALTDSDAPRKPTVALALPWLTELHRLFSS